MMNVFKAAASAHLTGVEAPTPRGSNPTTSYLSNISGLRLFDSLTASSMPEPPGPPGLTNRLPVGLPLLAGTLSMEIVIVLPPGFL